MFNCNFKLIKLIDPFAINACFYMQIKMTNVICNTEEFGISNMCAKLCTNRTKELSTPDNLIASVQQY